jgi:hypothetical protein
LAFMTNGDRGWTLAAEIVLVIEEVFAWPA